MKVFSILLFVCGLTGCAQVPTQSVALSTALGADLARTRQAHLMMVDLYYARVEADANRFVDTVYAPYQLGAALKQFPQINAAMSASAGPGASDQERQRAADMVRIFLTDLRTNTEDFRKKNLAPVREQRARMVAGISASYDNMLGANAAVTAYLSSLAKLNDAQNRAMQKIAPPGLQDHMSRTLVDVSEKIDTLHQAASKEAANGRTDVQNLVNQFELLMQLGTSH